MNSCKTCGSYAINNHLHGRDGSDGDLCDVCYWRKRSDELLEALKEAKTILRYGDLFEKISAAIAKVEGKS